MTTPPGSPYCLVPLTWKTELHRSCAIHRLYAMTTLPSLITQPVNGRPCLCLADGLHSGVVSCSQAQSPASIASMLLNRTLPAGNL